MLNHFESYMNLVQKIDILSDKLSLIHNNNILCCEKCCDCCINLSIFPVEFYAIKQQLISNNINLSEIFFDANSSCGFLKKALCQIYEFRPIICRTHGLPIVFYNEDLEEPEYSVSFCDKNFRNADLETFVFDEENTLNIDEINGELYSLNLKFINDFKEISYAPTDRIPLKQLLEI